MSASYLAKYWLHGMLFILLTIFCTMSGCSKPKVNTVVTNYPSFWKKLGGVESISFAPMENTTKRKGEEAGVRADVLQWLKQNEWPKVYDRQGKLWGTEVEMLEQEKQLNKGSGTKLILFTTLNDYRVEEIVETRYESTPIYKTNRRGEYVYDENGNHIIASYHDTPYTWRRNEAYVAISVRLVNIDTGELVFTKNFTGNWWSEGRNPTNSLSTCLESARKEAVWALITAVRVTSETITLEKDDLRTASELDEAKNWVYSNKFSIEQEKFRAVVRLPKSANLNEFILDFVVKDQKETIVSRKFTWDSKYGSFGYEFSPKEIATKGVGVGTYTVRLFQKEGMKLLLTHDFKITK